MRNKQHQEVEKGDLTANISLKTKIHDEEAIDPTPTPQRITNAEMHAIMHFNADNRFTITE